MISGLSPLQKLVLRCGRLTPCPAADADASTGPGHRLDVPSTTNPIVVEALELRGIATP